MLRSLAVLLLSAAGGCRGGLLAASPRGRSPPRMSEATLCEWVTPALNTSSRVMKTYFDVALRAGQSCEVFLVEGVPAASMVYNRTDKDGTPLVEAFHLNRALLLLFDAASHMRRLLHGRYRHIDLRDAANRDDFLLLP